MSEVPALLPPLTEAPNPSRPKDPPSRSRFSSTGCVVAVVATLTALCSLEMIVTKGDSSGSAARVVAPAPASPARATSAAVPAKAEMTEWVSHRLTHLRVRPQWRASALRVEDAALLRDLGEAISELWVGKLTGNEDAIFIGGSIDSNDWRKLRASINPTGVVWRIYRQRSAPRGDVAAVAAGFERGPSVRYSADYVAEQFRPRRVARHRAGS